MARYEYKGGWYTPNELSELSGIPAHTLRDRLRRGYEVEEAVKPVATSPSVVYFCEASSWEDWIGKSISEVHEIYWKWCLRTGLTPLSKQGFSRQVMSKYPMLKIVPTRVNDVYCRIIRLR